MTSRFSPKIDNDDKENASLLPSHTEGGSSQRLTIPAIRRELYKAWLECFPSLLEWARRLWYILRANRRRLIAALIVIIIATPLIVFLLQPPPPEPWIPNRYAWRDECCTNCTAHFALTRGRPKNDPSLETIYPDHPAWPFPTRQFPTRADAYETPPVSMYMGVFLTAEDIETRRIIRETYKRKEMRRPGTEQVVVVFVLGRPPVELQKEVEQEANAHGDLVVLNMIENMNLGKTYAYFHWTAQNAKVPDCSYRREYTEDGREPEWIATCPPGRWKDPDYVLKADGDSFLMLPELELTTRIHPRKMLYAGLLMYNFMGGECYTLSWDLVQHISTDKCCQWNTYGDEDVQVGFWLLHHPRVLDITWYAMRCWIYDHPRSSERGAQLSHGFLFPDVAAHIFNKSESIAGHTPPHVPAQIFSSWSTVVPWFSKYQTVPASRSLQRAMTEEQSIEAMVEGSPLSMLHVHNTPYYRLDGGGGGGGGGGEKEEDKAHTHGDEDEDEEYDDPERSKEMDKKFEQAWRARKTMDERMLLAREIGSTILVHQVKSHRDWHETELALLGPK